MENDNTKPKKRKRNYVNNPDFHEALVQYKAKCDESIANGKRLPQIPNYVGVCIMEMSKRIATKPRYSGYPFRDDMISDAIEICCRYIDRYDTTKYSNPFAYFTRSIMNSFDQRIHKEKKFLYTKFKSSQYMYSLGATYNGEADSDITLSHFTVDQEYMNNFIEKYEDSMEKKKEKLKLKNEEKKLLKDNVPNEDSDNY